MRMLINQLRRRNGQGYIEGFMVVWLMIIFLFALYAVGSSIWARTFAHTTTAFAAQQAYIAYDRTAFNKSAGAPDSEAAGIAAAQQAANTVINSVTEPSANTFNVLNLEPVGCNGSSNPWDSSVSVTTSNTTGLVTVKVGTNVHWKLGGFYDVCLPTERTITGDKQ